MARASNLGTGAHIELIGEFAGVQQMLHAADTAFSAVGLVSFLTGEVGPYVQARAKARFANEGDDVSGAWAPLSPATETIRQRGRDQGLWVVGDAHPINRRTGDLENYVTGGQGNVLPIGISGARLQYPRPSGRPTMRSKMKIAQKGGLPPNASHQAPPRPVLGLNERDLVYVLTMLSVHLTETGKRMGLRYGH